MKMKTANTFSKIKHVLFAIVFCLISTIAFVLPLSKTATADAAGDLTFSAQCTVSQIATNATNKEFYVYGIVSNNYSELFASEFRINIDTSVFEIKEYLTPTQLSKELDNPLLSNSYGAYKSYLTDLEAGYITCAVTGGPIKDKTFCIGGCKIAVKAGVAVTAGASSTITIDEVVLCDMYGVEPEYIQVYTSMTVWFVPPTK